MAVKLLHEHIQVRQKQDTNLVSIFRVWVRPNKSPCVLVIIIVVCIVLIVLDWTPTLSMAVLSQSR